MSAGWREAAVAAKNINTKASITTALNSQFAKVCPEHRNQIITFHKLISRRKLFLLARCCLSHRLWRIKGDVFRVMPFRIHARCHRDGNGICFRRSFMYSFNKFTARGNGFIVDAIT